MTRPTIIRNLSTSLAFRDDGRTVEGRLFAWNEPAEVEDTFHPDHPGEVVRYFEAFLPTAVDRQIQLINAKFGGVARYITFNLDHSQDLPHRIGYARTLDARSDGAHASFRLYERSDLDQVRSMLEESHSGLSVEFQPYDALVDGDLVARRSVNVVGVAATPIPAYESAMVTAVRGDPIELPELATPRLDDARAIFG